MNSNAVLASGASPRWLVLSVLCVAPFMVVLDSNVATIALPAIRRDLGFSHADLQWVITSYTLPFGGFLMVGGRAGDLYGRRRLLITGLALFCAASLTGALSPSGKMLLGARAVQGLGAAMAFPASLALITSLFAEGNERNRALGVYGAVASTAFCSGVIVGGVLIAAWGWRAVLLVNVPIGAVAALVAPRAVTENRRHPATQKPDLPGALAISGGLLVLIYGLGRVAEVGWLSWSTLVTIVLAGGIAGLAFALERGSPAPLVPSRLLRRKTLVTASLVALMTVGTGVGVMFLLSLYVQDILGYDPVQSGLALSLLGVAGVLGGIAAPRIAARANLKTVLSGALVVQAVGVACLIPISASGGVQLVLVGTAVVGLGHFGSTVMFTALGTRGLAEHDHGVTLGLLNSAQQIGAGVGLALLVAVASARTEALVQTGVALSREEAIVEGFRWALGVGAGMSALAAVLVLAGSAHVTT